MSENKWSIENPKCCGKKMFRQYAKEKLGEILYFDLVYICKECSRELFVTVREIKKDDVVHVCEEKDIEPSSIDRFNASEEVKQGKMVNLA